MEKRYMISDAAKLVDVEAHVLRYWEDELDIQIPRNEMGHRYYTDDIITLFREVKELKEQGFLLKAIKMLLPEIMDGKNLSDISINTIPVSNSMNRQTHTSSDTALSEPAPKNHIAAATANADSKMAQFEQILGNIVTKALEENNASLGHTVSSQVSDSVLKQMDYLMRMQEEREEDHYKKLDEAIRNCQRSGKEKEPKKSGEKHKRLSILRGKKTPVSTN